MFGVNPLNHFEVRPITSYIIAIGQKLAGIPLNQLPSKKWDWTIDSQKNIANGALPNTRVIYYSRLPMVILTTLSLIITVISISLAHSRFAAYCFFAFSFNSYFLEHLSRVMCESPLLLFSILSIITCYTLLQEIKKNDIVKIIFYSAIIGIFCGLAGESKLSGLFCVIVAIFVSFFGIYKYKDKIKNRRIKIFLISTLTIVFFTLLIFIITYPFFYHDTIARIIDTFKYRKNMMDFQVSQQIGIILPGQRIKVLLNRIFSYPVYLPSEVVSKPAILVLNMGITAYGVCYGIRNVYKKRNNKRGNIYLILLISTIFLSTPILFTPLDWDRYYLFPIYFTYIYFSIGLSQIGLYVIEKSRQIIKIMNKSELVK